MSGQVMSVWLLIKIDSDPHNITKFIFSKSSYFAIYCLFLINQLTLNF